MLTQKNHIHERALRIVYQDFTSSFAELLINGNSVSIHQRNLQLLVTEIYRTKMNINPSFMKEIFVEREINYNLRVMNSVYAREPRTTAYGLETISFLGQNLWRDLPLHVKKSQSVKHFKKHIKGWNFICNCRLCKSLLQIWVIFKHISVLHFLLGVISIDFSSHLLGFS